MGVPTDENTEFKIFGPTNGSDTTTIQGAIDQDNNGAVDNDTKFSQLIGASDTSKFDSLYAGVITNLNQVTCAEQYRGYPASSSNNSGLSSFFGSGNLIGHYGTTGYSTLSWEVIVNFTGYSEKTVTIGPSAACLHGCGYTSASRVSNSSLINGSGTIRVKRLTDSSSNSNDAVNDDGDVQLSVVGGTIAEATGLSRSNNDTVGSFGFSAGETFDETFTVSGLTVAAGDTFQLDITEG
tara:strand:+ start:637 stop:1350 length:714 start_codon:yes stop_codon:yes gene_type:complete